MSMISRSVLTAFGVALIAAPLAAQTAPCCCPGDLDADGVVGPNDLAVLQLLFGPCSPGFACPADLDGNGVVDGGDQAILLARFGACCPGDLDQSGMVDGADATLFQSCFAGAPCPPDPCCPADFIFDGIVDSAAVAIVSAAVGPCPPG